LNILAVGEAQQPDRKG